MKGLTGEIAGDHTVLVDMDGVLADFEQANNTMLEAHGVLPVLYRNKFYYEDTYKDYPGVSDMISRENRRPGFFRAFPLVDGAVEGWQRILNAGFTPRVCSSPLENHPTVIAEKKEWLDEHFASRFGGWVIDTAIFDRDKSGYDACAIIDDRPSVRSAYRARWQHVMFTRSYNTHIETDFRLHDWNDTNLERLLNRTRVWHLRQRSAKHS